MQPTEAVGATGTTTDVSCLGGSNGSIDLTPSGGTAPYTFSWSDDATTEDRSGLTAGKYSVTITDANGCAIASDFIINQPATAVAITAATQTEVSCFGGSNGSATVSVNGGTGSYSYGWSPSVGKGETVTGLLAGKYSVTVTDGNGCLATHNFTITQPDALVITDSQTNPSAYGLANGSATASVSGGTAPYTYLWSSGGTGATATGLSAGTYTVTVTDNNKCEKTLTYTLTQPAASSDNSMSNLVVSGGSLTPAFASGTLMYSASVEYATESIVLTPTVDINATVKINGKSVTNQSTVNVPLTIGSNTITIEVTAQDGTTKTYTLTVTRNQGGQTITFNAISAKIYGDAAFNLGAIASSGLSISYESGNPAVATVDAAGNVQIIKAGTVEFTAAQQGNGSYAAATSVKQTLVVKPAPLTIQADNQCKSGSDLPKLTLTYTGFVKDETALNLLKRPTVTTTATAESQAGNYPITVTDAESDNYAIKYIDGTLTIADATLSASGSISCKEPTVTLTATGGASYALSDGQTSKTGEFTVNKEGEYTVTVTTADGCVATDKVTVLAFTSTPQVTLTNDGPLTCANSAVTLTASPMVSETYCGKISYAYSGPGLVDSNASFGTTTVNAAGVYSVTLTDDYGCKATAETKVEVDQEVTTVVLTSDGSLSCMKTSVTLTATGGVSYQFDGGVDAQQDNTAIVTKPGTYSVKAKAANGCTATQQVVVTGDQTAPTAGLTDNGPLTCDRPTVLLTASGGKTYQFSTGTTALGENTATVQEAGIYSVTVTAVNGCTAVATTTVIGDQTVPTAELSNSGPITCANNVVTLTATGKGSYRFSQGADQVANGNTATVATAGTYSVTVTAANGCTAIAYNTVVDDQQVPVITLTGDGLLSCNKASVLLTASGGSSYRFSTGANQIANGNTASVSTAGTYSVTVTAANGCMATRMITVDQSAALVAGTGGQTNVSGNGGNNGSATVSVSGGTGSYSYSWSPSGGTTATATGLVAGTYTVTVTDANSCQTTQSFIITQPDALAADGKGSSQTNVSGNGGNNGSATVAVTGGVGPYTYSWSPSGGTAATASGLSAGTYVVTVTDANGNKTTQTFVITQPDALIVSGGSSQTNVSGNGGSNGSITAVVTGGVGPYTYSWSPTGGSAATASGLSAGVYTVTITDAKGNVTKQVFSLTQPAALVAGVGSQTNVSGNGASNGGATVSVVGGVGPYTYSWSPSGGTEATASGLSAGTYTVTVTDANGNVTTQVFVINQSPLLTASALVTEKEPILVTASGCAGTISWTVQGGTGVANGAVYTLSQPANYTLTARCTVGNDISVESTPLLVSIRPGNFAIASVNTVNCQLVDASRGEYWVTFTPVYSGLSGNPASFSIINEIVSTTATAPYTVRLYADNPVVTLVATQADGNQAQFAYSWRAICAGNTTANRAPVVTTIPDQQLVQDQPYQLDLTSYFADPDGQILTFTTSQLPAGLNLSGGRISGRPTGPGVSDVTVTALDPAGLQVSTSVRLRITAASEPSTTDFSITGVSNVTCVAVSASERRVSFSPIYSGLNGTAIRFRVVNEIDATTEPGPYTIRLYTDNPVVKLEAVQSGVTATYSYAWLNSCTNPTPPVVTNRPPVVSIPLVSQTATVGQGYSLYISRNTFTDPDGGALILTAEGLPAGLTYSTSLSGVTGTPASVGTSTIWITATDPGGLSVRTSFELTVKESTVVVNPPTESTPPTTDFAITGVSNVTCVAVGASERRVSFSPIYSGLNGTPIRFRVVNEIDATTDAGPYAIRLYTDNPVVKLEAVQSGVTATYSYAWLSTCDTPTPSPTPTPQTPSTPPVVTTPVTPPSTEFAITGVTTVSCEPITASERRVTFTPQYTGAGSGPISFRVVNEVDATTAAGPYTIRLYTDNPVVTLQAEQATQVASFRYEWLKACSPNGRQGSLEAVVPLQVTVFGNPVIGESVSVSISGADGQAVQVRVVDLLGNTVHHQSISQAGSIERLSVPLGRSQGVLLLRVSTPSQQQQIKLIRP
ncbi:putative Ig domain-containing protein [Spirosoma oryzae]|uniref:putative Ig domain-containing protein n=1 Tax=Spirosoma oryzae TaxID=1469603 RepID=UPI001FEC6C04|nr:putative Ig domain-containing protein [Spirosoma oryzae]